MRLGLLGRHQAANAATAIAAARRLAEQGWAIDEASLRGGLAAARCPARIEVVSRRPAVILDVAHNVASIAALFDVLRERISPRRRVLIFASSKDKDTAGMLRLLVPEFDDIVLTRYVNNPRAVEPETLATLVAQDHWAARQRLARPIAACHHGPQAGPSLENRPPRGRARGSDLHCRLVLFGG